MKRTLLSLAAAMLIAATASASVPNDEISVAGLYIGGAEDVVYKMYGQPQSVTHDAAGNTLIYERMQVSVNGLGSIVSIRTTSSRYQSTPAGANVGANKERIIGLYGEPDETIVGEELSIYRYFNEDRKQYIDFISESRTGSIVEILAGNKE